MTEQIPWPEFRQAMREASVERRSNNRTRGAERLREEGIEYEERNYGSHLIIKAGSVWFDYWPGTGKWTERNSGTYGRGISGLLARIHTRMRENGR